MKRVSHLKNVVSGQRLGGVPTQGHEIGSDGHREEDDVEDLKQGPWLQVSGSPTFSGPVVACRYSMLVMRNDSGLHKPSRIIQCEAECPKDVQCFLFIRTN